MLRKSIEDYASDLRAFLDALGLDRVVLVGHSMGGAIAQTLTLSEPERVSGLVLLGTGARLRVAPEFLEGIRIQFEQTVSLIDEWLWSPDTDSDLREKGKQMMIQAGPQVLLGDFQACDQFDVRDQVGNIVAPTLVLTGTEDRMTPARFGQWLADQISFARFVLIEGAGHMLMLERPLEIADQVGSFLAELT
jgi:pimeloyl-ACP methyl ester carboxylesterase